MSPALMRLFTWWSTKAWPVIKKAWKPILIVGGIVLLVFYGKRIWGAIVDSVVSKVDKPQPWTPITGNPTHVTVNGPNGPQMVELPRDDGHGNHVTSNQVGAVAWEPGYIAKVELKSSPINRR